MPEVAGKENQGQGASQGQGNQPTVEDQIAAAVKTAQTDLEDKFKTEIAGLNKANTKLQKDLEAKELEKLDEKTKAQKELELANQEKEKVLKETEDLKRQRTIEKAIFDAGLPQEFAKRINGQEEKEIAKDVKAFTDFIEVEVNKRVEVEVNKRLGGKTPQSGDAPKLGDLQSAYNEAKTKGNMPQMIAIKRQASKDGVTLNE